MNKIVFVIAISFSISTLGQQQIKEKIVGDWNTYLTAGDSGMFHFGADGSMFIKSPQGIIGKGEFKLNDGRVASSFMRYAINTNSNPIQIDFYFAVDHQFNVVGKTEGIIELLDDNLLRIALNNNKPQPIRPKNFDNPNESGVIARKGQIIELENCDKLKNGSFKMTDPFTGTTFIERKGDIQVETNDIGDKVKLKIEWTSECLYTLKPIEFYVNNKWIADTTGVVQTVQIIKIKKGSYIFSAGNNKTNLRITRELFMSKK